jgi:hypothetical protein
MLQSRKPKLPHAPDSTMQGLRAAKEQLSGGNDDEKSQPALGY